MAKRRKQTYAVSNGSRNEDHIFNEKSKESANATSGAKTSNPIKKSLNSFEWILLGLLLLLCIVPRLLFILHEPMNADESVYAVRAIDIIRHKSISTIDQAPVWFYLTDFSFSAFGTSDFAVRLMPLLASIGIAVLIFVMCFEYYGKTVAFASTALFALSNFAIRQTTEMNIVMTFFLMLSLYFFISAFNSKSENNGFWFLALAFAGASIAAAIKSTAILVFPVYLLFIIIGWKSLSCIKQKLPLKITVIALLSMIPMIPILVYNYLLNKYVGVYDILITEFVNHGLEGTTYQGLIGPVMKLSNLLPYTWDFLRALLRYDVLLLVLFVAGFVFARKMKYFHLIIMLFSVQFLMMALTTNLTKHYVNLIPLMAIIAGYCVVILYRQLTESDLVIPVLAVIIACLAILQFAVYHDYVNSSAKTQVRSYVMSNVPENALLVMDSRIYTNMAFWLGNDRTVMTNIDFVKLIQYYQNSTNVRQYEMFYVSCSSGDCGWGRDKIAPMMNDLDAAIVNQGMRKTIVFSDKKETYSVYKLSVQLPSEVVENAYMTNNFYMHNLRWRLKEGSLDDYTPKGNDVILHDLAFGVLFAVSIFALALLFVPYWLVIRD